MGNKKSRNARSRSSSKLFFNTESVEIVPPSITIPSICTSPSFRLSTKQSESVADSETINYTNLQKLYVQAENSSAAELTPTIVKTSARVLETYKKHLREICCDINTG